MVPAQRLARQLPSIAAPTTAARPPGQFVSSPPQGVRQLNKMSNHFTLKPCVVSSSAASLSGISEDFRVTAPNVDISQVTRRGNAPTQGRARAGIKVLPSPAATIGLSVPCRRAAPPPS
jgi:hypothetical protein